MTSAFDDRIVRVGIEIDGVLNTYEGLNIIARGSKYRSCIMGRCEVTIFNLTREHQQYILTKASPQQQPNTPLTPIYMTLDVGRESTGTFRLFEGAVFQGGISQPPDIGIVLYSLTNNFQLANTVNVSWPETSTIQQIAEGIASSMGLTLQVKTTKAANLVGNYSFTGSPQHQIKDLNDMGIIAYIDGKTLIITDPQQARGNAPRLISAATGLVGIPNVNTGGVNVQVMIDNSIEVGGEVQVESIENPGANGNYIINQLDFEVSNRNKPFWFQLDCQNKAFYTGTLS